MIRTFKFEPIGMHMDCSTICEYPYILVVGKTTFQANKLNPETAALGICTGGLELVTDNKKFVYFKESDAGLIRSWHGLGAWLYTSEAVFSQVFKPPTVKRQIKSPANLRRRSANSIKTTGRIFKYKIKKEAIDTRFL